MFLRIRVCCRQKTDKKRDGTRRSNANTVVGTAPGKNTELTCGRALVINAGGRELANEVFDFGMLGTRADRCRVIVIRIDWALGWINTIGLTPLSYEAAQNIVGGKGCARKTLL